MAEDFYTSNEPGRIVVLVHRKGRRLLLGPGPLPQNAIRLELSRNDAIVLRLNLREAVELWQPRER